MSAVCLLLLPLYRQRDVLCTADVELLLATLVLVGTRMADVTKVVASPTARTAYQRCMALGKSTLPLRPPTTLRNCRYRDIVSLVPHR